MRVFQGVSEVTTWWFLCLVVCIVLGSVELAFVELFSVLLTEDDGRTELTKMKYEL